MLASHPRMICKQCSVEIADRALICYRCGAPTVEARVKPPARRPQRGDWLLSLLALVVLGLAALYLGQVGSDQVPTPVAWIMVVLAAVIVVWRTVKRS